MDYKSTSKELLRREAEQIKEGIEKRESTNPLLFYSTSDLKKELRRRKRR